MDTECGGFHFISNFDSGNLGRVELVQPSTPLSAFDEVPDYEFNIWTRPDCAGTEFENGNRTWFYFGIKGGHPFTLLKLNILNLNKQSKIFSQGMSPVYKIVPGRQKWERIKEKPTFHVENHQFILSFKFRLQDSFKSTVYFSFTYPFTYTEQQNYLNSIELINKLKINQTEYSKFDDIYYHRELLCHSYDKRRVDLLTISSYHHITSAREPRFNGLFPDESTPRPFKFNNKKIIILSGRVHPGETPSSFVLIGIINLLLNKSDPIALALRRHFVFKIIPMLNPDGVYHGNYRTDTRGVNLNRVYNHPSKVLHPTIYGARAVILFAHHGFEVLDDEENQVTSLNRLSHIQDKVSVLTLCNHLPGGKGDETVENIVQNPFHFTRREDSGLFLYIDMHGHASKKGIFMYGNHFDEMDDKVDCMLLPKLISFNSQHFHFESCNFSEKNMYVKDKRDGSSREGSGRVSVLKSTGLVRSYTLECNYNTGKCLNTLPPPLREHLDKRPVPTLLVPPKYTPNIYEEVGRGIMGSVLDLIGVHPNSRLANSHHRTLGHVRDWLRRRCLQKKERQTPTTAPPHHLQVCLGESKAVKKSCSVGSLQMSSTSCCSATKRPRHPLLPRNIEKKKKKNKTTDTRPEHRRKKLRPT